MKTETDLPYWIHDLDEEMKRQLALKDKPKEKNK